MLKANNSLQSVVLWSSHNQNHTTEAREIVYTFKNYLPLEASTSGTVADCQSILKLKLKFSKNTQRKCAEIF